MVIKKRRAYRLSFDAVAEDAIANFEAMGFTDRAVNLELLRKHDNNVEAALNELLG